MKTQPAWLSSPWPLVIGLAVVCLNGCVVGPDYHQPRVAVPSHWRGLSESRNDDDETTRAWWRKYGDPELDALIHRALAANLDLKRAQDRLLEARVILKADRFVLQPSVIAALSANRGRSSANAPGVSPFVQGGDFGSGDSTQDLFQAGFDASWELDLFGGKRRAIEAAQAQMQGVAFERDAMRLSLIAEVARTYVELRSSQAQLEWAREIAENRKTALDLVRARFSGGLIADVDLADAEEQLQRARAKVPPWQAACAQAIHRLSVLMGAQPGALTAELATGNPLSEKLPPVVAGLPSDLLRRRPDIRSAERQLAAATARIGIATAQLYPDVTVGASLGLASLAAGDFFDPQSRIWAVGSSLTWPIFQRGKIKATISVRDIQAQEALLAYRRAILTALEDAEDALSAYRAERQRHVFLRAQLSTLQRAYENVHALYQGGMTDLRVVLDRRQRVLQTQADLEASTKAEWLDWIAITKAVGGEWNSESTDKSRSGQD